MKTFHIYGRTYCRGDETTFEETITEEMLLNIKQLCDDQDDDAIEDLWDDMKNWNIMSIVVGGLAEDDLDIKAIIRGEAQSVSLEEHAAGIGLTLRDAKIAFVDAE